jgi:hypothetical protein
MALVDPASYRSFVDGRWTFDQIIRRFKEQIRGQRLLIWGTGREDFWRVEIRLGRSSIIGFREFAAPLRATKDHLLLTNYESLTMAAQVDDVRLPQRHQADLLFPVATGLYLCRIVQRHDPIAHEPAEREDESDFIIELIPTEDAKIDEVDATRTRIPWTDF